MTLLEIFNIALKPHGKRCNASDLSSQNPPYEVELCKTYYKSAVRKALGEADWPECVKKIAPVQGYEPRGHWSYSFPIPRNIIRVSQNSTKPYAIENGFFLTDCPDPDILVVDSRFDCEKASDGLCELVGLALAYTLCGLLSPADNAITQVIMQSYNWALSPMVSALSFMEIRSPEEGGPCGIERPIL